MNAALIPVRSIAGAKNRLAEILDASERRQITLEMLADMLEALAAADSVDAIYVVSADDELLAHARDMGAEPVHEGSAEMQAPGATRAATAGGLNRAVAAASRLLAARGFERLLTIPGDVPLIEPADVDALFAASGPSPSVVLAPSRSTTGTNGLLVAPPGAIVPRFEGESLVAHQQECRAAGVACRVVGVAGFELDVDTFADLADLADGPASKRSVRVAAKLLERRAA